MASIEFFRACARYFKGFSSIYICKRVDENLLYLILDKLDSNGKKIESKEFFIDLSKGESSIFCAQLNTSATFSAPFDRMLQSISSHAKIQDVLIDGDNRILIFHLSVAKIYKIERYILQFEFTGKYTNAIILNENKIVLESLRHISKSIREVKVGTPLQDLKQKSYKTDGKMIPQNELEHILKQNYIDKNANILASKKANILAILQKKIDKNNCILKSLPNKSELENTSKIYKTYGEQIFTHIHTIGPIYDDNILIKEGDSIISIPLPKELDPSKKSVSYVGNLYFTLSKKLSKKAQNIYLQIQNLEEKNRFLQAQINIIKEQENTQYIDIFTKKMPKKRALKNDIYESFFINGIKISFGKNERENIALLKDAKANEMWLHIRDFHASHMIIHATKIDDATLEKCGEILAKLQGKSGNFQVDHTLRKFVKITGGANVVYAKYSTLNYKI